MQLDDASFKGCRRADFSPMRSHTAFDMIIRACDVDFFEFCQGYCTRHAIAKLARDARRARRRSSRFRRRRFIDSRLMSPRGRHHFQSREEDGRLLNLRKLDF